MFWFATWYVTIRNKAEAARTLLESLTIEQPGFVCRKVIVELVWVLERSYKCSRDQIATVLEQLATTESLVVEDGSDVIRAASRYRSGNAGFSDLMICQQPKGRSAIFYIPLTRKQHDLKGSNCCSTKKSRI